MQQHSNLDLVAAGEPTAGYGKQGETMLVVSRERVGRIFVVQALREHGLHTVVSDNAQQAVRRINSGQCTLAGIVIVGDLPDGTAESYQRWLRGEGHHAMPLIAIGTALGESDPFARQIDPREWPDCAAEVLHSLGLIDRRRTERPTADAVIASTDHGTASAAA